MTRHRLGTRKLQTILRTPEITIWILVMLNKNIYLRLKKKPIGRGSHWPDTDNLSFKIRMIINNNPLNKIGNHESL